MDKCVGPNLVCEFFDGGVLHFSAQEGTVGLNEDGVGPAIRDDGTLLAERVDLF
jgi:hypothetical protein